MDIINSLPEKKFEEIDDLLAFISIYDDEKRTEVYFNLLEENKHLIENKICVELGCGLGIMSEKLALLGAKKIYAVEKNPYLFSLAKKRLQKYEQIKILNINALDFIPNEPIDLLLHEFYGQMLYDEELFILKNLKFKPKIILPDSGKLKFGLGFIEDFEDEFVDIELLKKLDGVLVSGLFDEEGSHLQFEAAHFNVYKGLQMPDYIDITNYEGNLLYFGVELWHNDKKLCQAGECPNWSYIWTYRSGNKFKLHFQTTDRGTEVFFDWLT